MRLQMTILSIVMLTISIAVGIVAITVFNPYARIIGDRQAEEQCRRYEADGVLVTGSCSCAEKIYERWSESYDWMDACAILRSREGR